MLRQTDKAAPIAMRSTPRYLMNHLERPLRHIRRWNTSHCRANV